MAQKKTAGTTKTLAGAVLLALVALFSQAVADGHQLELVRPTETTTWRRS